MSTQNYKYVVVEDEHLIRKNIIKKYPHFSSPLHLPERLLMGWMHGI